MKCPNPSQIRQSLEIKVHKHFKCPCKFTWKQFQKIDNIPNYRKKKTNKGCKVEYRSNESRGLVDKYQHNYTHNQNPTDIHTIKLTPERREKKKT